MDVRKQLWSVEETSCLFAIWSSTEIQNKLEGLARTRPVFLQIQREMAAAGYDRSIDQINNKLKKLKKNYRDQRRNLDRGGDMPPRGNPHFDALDSFLGDRPACRTTGALNSATAMLEMMVDDRLPQTPEPESSTIENYNIKCEQPSPPRCSSPAPSSSSGVNLQTADSGVCPGTGYHPLSPQSSRPRHRPRPRKRKKDNDTELLEYLKRADERFLEHSKDLNDALLQQLDTETNAFLGLMGRMVSLMEARAKK